MGALCIEIAHLSLRELRSLHHTHIFVYFLILESINYLIFRSYQWGFGVLGFWGFEARAEIFRSFFGSNENFQKSFRYLLTFRR